MNRNLNFQKENHGHGREPIPERRERPRGSFRTEGLSSTLCTRQSALRFPGRVGTAL